MNKSSSEIHCPVCTALIEDESTRKKCDSCGNGDRTRTLFLLYRDLGPITKSKHALVFTAENWLTADRFETCERSIFRGRNHLDIQEIDKEDGTFSWIASNHVLEHVPRDDEAIVEMFRVLSNDGIAQITIPTPNRAFETTDWGFADESKMGHYRNYGADFPNILRSHLPQAYILSAFVKDSLSDFIDVVYFLAKDAQIAQQLTKVLLARKSLVVQDFPT